MHLDCLVCIDSGVLDTEDFGFIKVETAFALDMKYVGHFESTNIVNISTFLSCSLDSTNT